MILSNDGIRTALRTGDIEISPVPTEEQYTTSAVDLFLGSDFRQWDSSKFEAPGIVVNLDLAVHAFQKTANAYLVKVPLDADNGIIFPPYSQTKSHLLGITKERIHMRSSSLLAARVEGRSSLARVGLVVHLTAPIIHAGFNGHITLEMINFSPFYLKLIPGKTRICQIVFERLESAPQGEIRTGFQGQTQPSGQ